MGLKEQLADETVHDDEMHALVEELDRVMANPRLHHVNIWRIDDGTETFDSESYLKALRATHDDFHAAITETYAAIRGNRD